MRLTLQIISVSQCDVILSTFWCLLCVRWSPFCNFISVTEFFNMFFCFLLGPESRRSVALSLPLYKRWRASNDEIFPEIEPDLARGYKTFFMLNMKF